MKKNIIIKGMLLGAAVLVCSGMYSGKAEAAVKTMSDGGLFDPSYYAATYDDVYKAFGMNEKLLYQHYLQYGRYEKRKPYAGYEEPTPTSGIQIMSDGGLFDPKYYADKNPDVVKVYGKSDERLYQHYLEYGKKEGRLPYANANKTEKIKLQFQTSGQVTAEPDKYTEVVEVIRKAAKYHVEETIIRPDDWEDVSLDDIENIVAGQKSYLKKTYGVKSISTTPRVYGSVDNLTTEVILKMKF